MTKDELISYLRRHAGGYSVPGVDNHNLAKWLEGAPAAPAPATELSDDELDALIPQWRHTTAAANEVCWQRRDVRQAMRAAIAAAPAAPAPAGFVLVPLEPTPEMLKRFDGFEFRAPFDPKHAALREGLWRSLLNAAPAAPAQAEAKPAVEPVARVEQVKSSTQFRLIWLQRPVEGVLYAAPAAPASHPDTELLDWLDKEASVGNGLHLACLSGGLRSAIAARIARDKAASKESGNGQ